MEKDPCLTQGDISTSLSMPGTRLYHDDPIERQVPGLPTRLSSAAGENRKPRQTLVRK